MNDMPKLILYAVGGLFVLMLIYTIRDYIVIGLVSAGAVYVYKLTTGKNDRR